MSIGPSSVKNRFHIYWQYPTFFHWLFYLYLNTAYAAHYVYKYKIILYIYVGSHNFIWFNALSECISQTGPCFLLIYTVYTHWSIYWNRHNITKGLVISNYIYIILVVRIKERQRQNYSTVSILCRTVKVSDWV